MMTDGRKTNGSEHPEDRIAASGKDWIVKRTGDIQTKDGFRLHYDEYGSVERLKEDRD